MPVKYSGASSNYLSLASSWTSGISTIACWARANSLPGSGAYYNIWRRLAGGQELAGSFYNSGGNLKATTWDGTTETSSTATLRVGQWYHLAWVHTSATAWQLFVNGVADHTGGTASSSLSSNSFVWGVWDATTDVSNATYADIRIWSGLALSSAQLQTEMRSPAPVATTALWAWWPLYNGIPVRPLDFSGNNRTLTLTGTLLDDTPPPVPLLLASERYWFMPAFSAAGGGTNATATDAAGLSAAYATAETITVGVTITDAIGAAIGGAVAETVSAGAAITDALGQAVAASVPESIAAGAGVTDAAGLASGASLPETISAGVSLVDALGQVLGVSTAETIAAGAGALAVAGLALGSGTSEQITASATVTDDTGLGAAWGTTDGVSMASLVAVDDALGMGSAWGVSEVVAAGVSMTDAPGWVVSWSAPDAVSAGAGVTDAAGWAWGADAPDGITAGIVLADAAGLVLAAGTAEVIDIQYAVSRYILRPLGAPADRVRATATRSRLRGQNVDRTRS